jgi:hypothetical protein
MASVHGVSCDMVKGAGVELAQRTEVWATPGMDGVGAQNVGRHQGAMRFLAVLFDTSANVTDWFSDLEAKQGSIGTIVDDWGTSHTNCLIVHVGERIKRAAKLPGDSMEARGEMEIVARKTA